jgi:processive 1,2-diacylglycerol beta-glucosyltransferase
MNKIMILYTASGTGHYIAAKAIAEEIKKRDNEISVLMFDPLKFSRPLIDKLFKLVGRLFATKFRVKRGEIYNQKMYKEYLKESNFSIFCKKLFWTKKLKNKINKYNPNLIISTQVGPTILMASHKNDNINAKVVSVFTDYGLHRWYTFAHKGIDLYCAPSFEIKDEMIKLGLDENKIEVTGIPVLNQFKANLYDRKQTLNKYNLPENNLLLLFVCGGGLGISNGFKYFEKMLENDGDFSYIFIAGNNKNLEKRAHLLVTNSRKKGVVLGYVNNMAELINASDLVIGKPGGLITSESLAMNKPFCAIEPIPGQEIKNANFLTNNNYGYFIKNIDNFCKLISNLSKNKDQLNEYEKNIKKNFMKNSSSNIVEKCLNILKNNNND